MPPGCDKLNKFIRVSKSSISNAEKIAVRKVLDQGYLGMGDNVKIFERDLSIFFGRPATCVSSGTAAIQLSLQAIGIMPGDEILVPSLTYVATFQAISATGAIPVACDVNLENLMIDIDDAKKRLSKKTKAIIPVHYSGDVCNLNHIYSFAKINNLRVIEDAAHAFGSTYKKKIVGSFGDIACFSFDGIKNITSGEGGCIITNDKNVNKKIKDARLLGVIGDSQKRFLGKRSWQFDVVSQGWRYHMSNIMAAIGSAQLDKFTTLSNKRKKIAIRYDENLNNESMVELFRRNYEKIVPHIYVIKLDKSINRKKLMSLLYDRGIETGIHYVPNHTLTYYKKNDILPLNNTEKVSSQILSLPIHPGLSLSEVDYVCKILLELISKKGL